MYARLRIKASKTMTGWKRRSHKQIFDSLFQHVPAPSRVNYHLRRRERDRDARIIAARELMYGSREWLKRDISHVFETDKHGGEILNWSDAR